MSLAVESIDFFENAIAPKQEILCYESLWAMLDGTSLKELSERLNKKLPSSLQDRIRPQIFSAVSDYFNSNNFFKYDVLLRETIDYPKNLSVLELPLLYYKGDLSLISAPCISIVGSRKASERGLRAAEIISKGLCEEGYTIVSGLAHGVDTTAHKSAIKSGGKTIGVIGTPIDRVYPKENDKLHKIIGEEHLLLSHVPFYKYAQQDWRVNRLFFPERNKVMAALSEATIIVEASDTSGTLTQARECMRVNKKLIILRPNMENNSLKWPKTYRSRGAYIADTLGDIKNILNT
ncbi:MAG: DNA-protecting protein DprA [Desulfovibrio sp.]|jgi:DNA processing protein|nr:DNA-protecting protein DprA [Desulfovibrio sp.]